MLLLCSSLMLPSILLLSSTFTHLMRALAHILCPLMSSFNLSNRLIQTVTERYLTVSLTVRPPLPKIRIEVHALRWMSRNQNSAAVRQVPPPWFPPGMSPTGKSAQATVNFLRNSPWQHLHFVAACFESQKMKAWCQPPDPVPALNRSDLAEDESSTHQLVPSRSRVSQKNKEWIKPSECLHARVE